MSDIAHAAWMRRNGLLRLYAFFEANAPRTSAIALLSAHAPIPPQSLPEAYDDE